MTPTSRRAYIDWARGIAVLLMIEAHTFDSWTRTADRGTLGFRNATILGGFAAPLFLWLAGVSIPLAAARTAARLQDRRAGAAAVCRRGLEIFVLAFLFRIQAFVLSPGSAPVTIFRVDILNIMGPAIAAAAALYALRLSSTALVALYGAIALTVAMVTPIVRLAPFVGLLPTWLQWYVRPAGEFTTFSAFPWAGFVFAGAAAGVLLERYGTPLRERALLAGIGVAGALFLAIGFGTAMRPTIYTQSYFWTSSPTYFAVRIGIMMIALALLFALETLVGSESATSRGLFWWLRPLATLGRHSLFIYWIHVELVYGYASWLWWRRLPLWGTAIAYCAFVVLIYQAIPLKASFDTWWRGRGRRAAPVAA